MTLRNSFAGLPAFLFGDGGLHNQLVCDVRTFVRAVDGDGRTLLAPMVAWSPGPPAIGDTGDNSPGHMMGTTWLLQVCPDGSWVLYREDRGRLEVVPFDDPPDPVTATARHVSLCFDQSARVVLAWEDQGIIKVRRWDPSQNEYIENVSFAGVDPVVVFDAEWRYRVPDSDVLLFYLSSDREKVMCRVQRDVYGTEYEIWDYGQPVILDRVIATPLRYQILVSDQAGTPLPEMLLSAFYPYPTTNTLRVPALGPTAASYTPIVIQTVRSEAALVASAGPTAGAYTDPMLFASLAETLAAVAEGSASGAYLDPIVHYAQTEDLSGAATGPTEADYALVVLNHTLSHEGVTVSTEGPTGGTYA